MIISKTPLRISFVGGGSDLKEYYSAGRPGAVVSTAIDKYVYVMVNSRFDGSIRVGYSKSETVSSVDEIEHDIIREALRLTGIKDSIEITYVGDMPIGRAGTGLGSSSALAVGLLAALYRHIGKKADAKKLAEQACKIEIDILKRPIGKQDQYASAFGGLNHITFGPGEKVPVAPLKLSKAKLEALQDNLLLFYTNTPSKSSEVLSEQREKTPQNIDVLHKMVDLVGNVKKSLTKGAFADLGKALHENWMHKKKLAGKMSSGELDAHYEKALKAGALGGKILGSGGGGFFLFYCDKKNQKKLRQALSPLKEVPFRFEKNGSTILFETPSL